MKQENSSKIQVVILNMFTLAAAIKLYFSYVYADCMYHCKIVL